MFEELDTSKRMEDPKERKAGEVLKSKKKAKMKSKKTSSISFSQYKFIKNTITTVLSVAIVGGLFYLFYLGVKVFIS